MNKRVLFFLCLYTLILIIIVFVYNTLSNQKKNKFTSSGNYLSGFSGYTVTDSKFKPICESSGGQWFEEKGQDSVSLCGDNCPENVWRRKNWDKVISSGCSCQNNCYQGDWNTQDFKMLITSPKPTKPPGTIGKVVLQESYSSCKFKALVDNACQSCTNDADCKDAGKGVQSSYWLRISNEPVCVDGFCRYKQTVYYE